MNNREDSHPPQTSPHQYFWFPYALVFYEAVLYLSNDMYLPSLPRIAAELGASQDVTQYTLTLWFLGTCTFQLFLTSISERFGRRNVILSGCGLFLVSSFLCATAPTIEVLLAARFLQGSVVSTVTVAGYAAVHEVYSSKKTVKLLSIMASVTLLAPAAGPIVGSWFLEYFSWRFIFYLITFMGVCGALGIYIFMPDNEPRRKTPWRTVVTDYGKLVRNARFMRYALGLSIIISAFFIWIVEAPFVVVSGLKKAPSTFGWLQLFVFGSFGVGSQIAKLLVDRMHVSNMVRLASAIIFVGALSFLLTSYFTDNLYWIIGSMVMISIGSSQTFGTLNRLAVEASAVTMVSRTALLSLLICLTGTFASFAMTLFNNQTFFNMAVVIFVFLMMGLFLVVPATKEMSFKET